MMSNAPKLSGPMVPRGDMGIGFCYRCIQYMLQREIAGDDLAGFAPGFAVTMAPWPIPELGIILALPACYDCLAGKGRAGAPGTGLLVPRRG